METVVKKYQHKFRKVKEETQRWEELQSRLISQFSNASSVIHRLQVIGDKKYYGRLRGVDGIEAAVLQKQLDSLETILLSIKNTMEDFRAIVLLLEKMVRDGRQLLGGGSQLSARQLKRRVGVKPSLSDCLDGLNILHEMHGSDFWLVHEFNWISSGCIFFILVHRYLLKTSVVCALSELAFKTSATDLGALQQLLIDQPNIPRDEVQFIFDIILSEEIC